MLALSTQVINRSQSLSLIGSLDFTNSQISRIASAVFRHAYSSLSFCDSWSRTLTHQPLVTLLPGSISYLISRSINSWISKAKSLDEKNIYYINKGIFVAKTIITTATCLVTMYLFFETAVHLTALHRNSKNCLKFVYFIYQLYKSVKIFQSLYSVIESNLFSLNEIQNAVKQAKNLTFEKVEAGTEQEYHANAKVIWFKNYVKTLSDEQITQALNVLFPTTLTIYDLANILSDKQFNELVTPRIEKITREAVSLVHKIRTFLGEVHTYSEQARKATANGLFHELNTSSKRLFTIINQINKLPEDSAIRDQLKDLEGEADKYFKLFEPGAQRDYNGYSDRKGLLKIMFKQPHIFNDNDEAWPIVMFSGLDITDLPTISLKALTSPSKHPIENIQESLKVAGLETYQNLIEKGILTPNAEGNSPSEQDLLGRFIPRYITSAAKSLFQPFLWEELAIRSENLAERFLLKTGLPTPSFLKFF